VENVEVTGVVDQLFEESRIISVAKPPWVNREHRGKLERLILQIGRGKGNFSELDGIRRSIGCIGNNRFFLRREPMDEERFKKLIHEFSKTSADELYLTNYDDLDLLIRLAAYASSLEIEDIYMVVRIEDMNKVPPMEGVNIVVEADYNDENLKRLEALDYMHSALLLMEQKDYEEILRRGVRFPFDVYIDIIYPRTLMGLKLNPIELRRIDNPTSIKYSPCLSGTLTIAADGYALICPLMRKFIVGDAKKEGIRALLRKTRLKNFWRLTKDMVEGCSKCPFKYVCHDCRALEYQATGDLFGLEYCPLEL